MTQYDASLCLALANRSKNYMPPWTRDYATFRVVDSKLVNNCPSQSERDILQHNYKLNVLKNKNRQNINLSKKQQYAYLVKNGYYSKNHTYASNTIPNISNFEVKNNTVYLCPGKPLYKGPTHFAGPKLYFNKH